MRLLEIEKKKWEQEKMIKIIENQLLEEQSQMNDFQKYFGMNSATYFFLLKDEPDQLGIPRDVYDKIPELEYRYYPITEATFI